MMNWTRRRLGTTLLGVYASSFAAGMGCGSDHVVLDNPCAADASADARDAATSDASPASADAGHPLDASHAPDASPGLDASQSPDASGGATCPADCGKGRACCNGACVDLRNDPHNCGTCGNECKDDRDWCNATDPGVTPFCDAQRACAVDYNPPRLCPGYAAAGLCCGYDCCERGQLCCTQNGGLACITPTPEQPTCPPLPPDWPFAAD